MVLVHPGKGRSQGSRSAAEENVQFGSCSLDLPRAFARLSVMRPQGQRGPAIRGLPAAPPE